MECLVHLDLTSPLAPSPLYQASFVWSAFSLTAYHWLLIEAVPVLPVSQAIFCFMTWILLLTPHIARPCFVCPHVDFWIAVDIPLTVIVACRPQMPYSFKRPTILEDAEKFHPVAAFIHSDALAFQVIALTDDLMTAMPMPAAAATPPNPISAMCFRPESALPNPDVSLTASCIVFLNFLASPTTTTVKGLDAILPTLHAVRNWRL